MAVVGLLESDEEPGHWRKCCPVTPQFSALLVKFGCNFSETEPLVITTNSKWLEIPLAVKQVTQPWRELFNQFYEVKRNAPCQCQWGKDFSQKSWCTGIRRTQRNKQGCLFVEKKTLSSSAAETLRPAAHKQVQPGSPSLPPPPFPRSDTRVELQQVVFTASVRVVAAWWADSKQLDGIGQRVSTENQPPVPVVLMCSNVIQMFGLKNRL